MSRFLAGVLTLSLMVGGAGADYLTNDGKLSETLVVKELQGGFAGFTGKQITIKPDGKWEEANVFQRKTTVQRSGTLTKEQMKKLAAELKKFDAQTLKTTGTVRVNPKVISIAYGKNSAELNLTGGAEMPKPDAKSLPGRFAGIVAAVHAVLPRKGAGGGSDS